MSYIDQRDAAIVAIQAIIGPNGTGAITGQVHQNNEVAQTNDAYLNLVGYDNFAYVIVRTGINVATGAEDDTSTRNGTNLVLAYAAASALTPGGSALGPNNRVAVLVPPGVYSLGSGVLNMDTQYVDLIGLGAAEDVIITSVFNTANGTGTITKSVDNAVIKNVTIKNDAVYAAGPDPGLIPSGYAPQAAYPNEVLENVILKSDATKNPFMRQDFSYAGTYRNVRAIGPNPVGPPTWVMFAGCTGTFESCTTSEFGFGYYDGTGLTMWPVTGTYRNCRCWSGFGYDAFVTNTMTISASYYDCEASLFGFAHGALSTASFYERCKAGEGWIVGTFIGEARDCYSSGSSNGFAITTAAGALIIRCRGGNNTFSLGGGTATFTDCIGGSGSFIGTGGTYINCSASGASFTASGSVVMYGCVGGVGSFNNSTTGGTYTDCSSGDNSFAGAGGVYKGCFAGNNSFSGETGVFSFCEAGNNSFNGLGAGVVGAQNGTYFCCKAGNGSFGSGWIDAGGTFTNCSAGNWSFGASENNAAGEYAIASGKFYNCTGGDNCFGAGSGGQGGARATGEFYNCKAGRYSFGSNNLTAAVTQSFASGRFEDCTAGHGSFAGHVGALKNGKFIRCILQGLTPTTYAADDYGPLVENGVMEDCIWQVSDAAEHAIRVANTTSPIVGPDVMPKIYGGKYVAGAGATASIGFTNIATATPSAAILQIRANIAIDPAIVNGATAGALDSEGNYIYSAL